MSQPNLFLKLIEHVNASEDLETGKKRHICSALEYFKNQLLTDLDRRDNPEQLKKSWLEFEKLTQGSKLFDVFKSNKRFWTELESSVGIIRKLDFTDSSPTPTKRLPTVEEFFLDLSHKASSTIPESPEKKLILFGLWCLALEGRLAKPYRTQSRIELIYRYIHPRLKAKGLLKEYENDKEIEKMIRYFIKGTIY